MSCTTLKRRSTGSRNLGGITNLDFDAFEKAIFLSGTAPEAVADAALQRIGLTGLAKKSMDINELKRSEDLSRGLSSYPTRMFNLIKEKSKVPLGHVHKIRKKVESQPEEALKLLLALFESEPESKAHCSCKHNQRSGRIGLLLEKVF